MIGLIMVAMGRVGCLTGERIFFHYLGEGQNGLATTLVAFGGADVLLWLAAGLTGGAAVMPGAFYPSLVYASHFVLYTTAFGMGPVSEVSPWTNVTVLMLFFIAPVGGVAAGLGLLGFAIGMGFFLQPGGRNWMPIGVMVASDLLLVIGRLFDLGRASGAPLAYAANMYGWVTLWLAIAVLVLGRGGDTVELIRRRPGWAGLASASNAASYVSLVLLIHRLPLAILESLGSVAALLASLIGTFWLMEPIGRRKMMASWLMSGGAVLLLWDHLHSAKGGGL